MAERLVQIVDPAQRIDQMITNGVEERRNVGLDVSETHSEVHLRNVRNLAPVVGKLYDFKPRELFLTTVPGGLHDYIRSSSEDERVGDEIASANAVDQMLFQDGLNGGVILKPHEFDAIHYAIAHHSEYPEMFSDSERRNQSPTSLSEKLHVAVFVADKMEANGPRVIERRSSFVAGDRLHEEGDWQNFGFKPESSDNPGDELTVVALESIIRMAYKNPKDIYPDALRPLVDPLYAVQEEYFLGVCRASSLSLREMATLLTDRRNNNGRNILEASKVKNPPKKPQDILDRLQELGISEESVVLVEPELAEAARETVYNYSRRYKDPMDQVTDEWDPQTEIAKNWKQGMLRYRSGEWASGLRQQIGNNS